MIAVKISEEALDDLQDGFWFYEAQEAGVGDYFIACLRAAVEGLKVTDGIHRVVYKDYHRLLSRVFPYAIFSTFIDDIATVWAVLDYRRDPRWIRERLE
jgi:hypothetical protein